VILLNVDELTMQGFSCSQVILMMTMDQIGMDEDENLVRAMKGLTQGMGVGHACGIVTGAACAFSLAAGARGASELFPLFYQWFYENYGEACGGINCLELLDGDINSRLRVCPEMISASWGKVSELLEL
jgi:C_GCAxxG_C_C family probable redox protein